jgi:translation elongation factor EF-1beta
MAALKNFTNLTDIKGQGKLNGHLGKVSFVDGNTPSSADTDIFNQFIDPPSDRFGNTHRWFTWVSSFTPEERATWRAEGAPAECPPEPTLSKKKEEKPAKGGDDDAVDDDFDFFGDDDEDAIAELNAQREKSKKKVVIEKSSVCFGVNPTEVDVDWQAIEDHVRSISMEGLEWKASVLEDIAFGIKKLKITMNIIDSLVSTDEVEELIQASLYLFEEHGPRHRRCRVSTYLACSEHERGWA